MAQTKATVNPSEKVTNEIIRLKHLHATSVVVKIEDVLKFLEDISNDLNQPVDPEEPDQPEEN